MSALILTLVNPALGKFVILNKKYQLLKQGQI
jgi:hypothetical protein